MAYEIAYKGLLIVVVQMQRFYKVNSV